MEAWEISFASTWVDTRRGSQNHTFVDTDVKITLEKSHGTHLTCGRAGDFFFARFFAGVFDTAILTYSLAPFTSIVVICTRASFPPFTTPSATPFVSRRCSLWAPPAIKSTEITLLANVLASPPSCKDLCCNCEPYVSSQQPGRPFRAHLILFLAALSNPHGALYRRECALLTSSLGPLSS